MTHANAKGLAGVLGLLTATTAAAQGAPTVNESTGDLTYTYAFHLPKARGRYQPELALVYSTGVDPLWWRPSRCGWSMPVTSPRILDAF